MELLETVKVTTFNDYQCAAMRTCTESSRNIDYMALELLSEVGEVVGKMAKMIRDNDPELRQGVIDELGDVMWGVAGLCAVSGRMLGDVLDRPLSEFNNPRKLNQRLLVFEAIAFLNEAGLVADSAVRGISIYDHLVETVMDFAHAYGSTLQEVLQHNIDKLTDRWNRGKIHGSGDKR